MTKLCVFIALCLSLTGVSVAQQFQRIEAFGGYSYMYFKPEGGSGLNLNYGWNTAMQLNVNCVIGLKADISGHYSTPVAGSHFDAYNFLAGPVFSNRLGKATPFVHALAGLNRITTNAAGLSSSSDNSFAMAFGGGVDVYAARHVAVRPIQVEYLFSKHGAAPSNVQNNVRMSAGVVFGFGAGSR
jgi:opacity protein-like surface antigen